MQRHPPMELGSRLAGVAGLLAALRRAAGVHGHSSLGNCRPTMLAARTFMSFSRRSTGMPML